MRRRYTIDAESGDLLDRDGNSLGRVVGLTLETPAGGKGGKSFEPSLTTEENSSRIEGRGVGEPQTRPTATQLERGAVEKVWAHYLELVPSRRKLDAKRSRIIRNALAIVRSAYGCDLEEAERLVKQAVLGLSRSPFHNGQNDQHKKYLEIRYALKGIGDESDDERIEKAIAWAQIYTTVGTHADGRPESVDEAKLQRWLDDVRYTISLPHRPERDRAVESLRRLRAHDFDVERFERPPWARLVRK